MVRNNPALYKGLKMLAFSARIPQDFGRHLLSAKEFIWMTAFS